MKKARGRNGPLHRTTYNDLIVPRSAVNDIALEQLFSLEGIIAKRKRGVYTADGKDWLKIKNPRYSRAEGRHELLKRER